MTATQLQLRRDTFSNLAAATPASGEAGYDTTNKRLVIGDGVRAGGYQIPNFSDVQKQTFTYAVAAGTGNAVTLAYTFPTLADVDGLELGFKATANNTGSATIAVDGRSALTVKKIKDGTLSDLEADDIINGCYYKFTKIGSYYQLLSIKDGGSANPGWDLLAIATGGGATYDFTSGIDSNYDDYALDLDNLIPATTGQDLSLRIRRAGQGSFDSGASDYEWLTNVAHSSATVKTDDTADGEMDLMQSAQNAAAGGTGVSGLILCHALPLTARSHFRSKLCGDTTLGNGYFLSDGYGARLSTAAIDGLRLFFTSGNISSGTAKLFGIRSSL